MNTLNIKNQNRAGIILTLLFWIASFLTIGVVGPISSASANQLRNSSFMEKFREEGDFAAFSSDGNILAAVDADGLITLRDVMDGSDPKILTGQSTGFVNGIVFRADGKILASAGKDAINLWDVGSGQELLSIALDNTGSAIARIAISSDGKGFAGATLENEILLWNLKTGFSKSIKPGQGVTVEQLKFSPDGKFLASVNNGRNSNIKLWDAVTGKLKAVLPAEKLITDLEFSPNGNVLASVHGGIISLWDTHDLSAVHRIIDTKEEITDVVFSPDSKTLASSSSGKNPKIQIWNRVNGDLIFEHPAENGVSATHLFYSHDGGLLASFGEDSIISLFDVPTGKLKQLLVGPSGLIAKAAFNSKQPFLVAITKDGEVFGWDLMTGVGRQIFQVPTLLSSSLVGSQASSPISLNAVSSQPNVPNSPDVAKNAAKPSGSNQDVDNAKASSKRRAHNWKGVKAIALSQDGMELGVAGEDGTIRIFNKNGSQRLKASGHHGRTITGLAFRGKTKEWVSIGEDTEIKTWDSTGKNLQTFYGPENPPRTVAVSTDGRFIAVAGESTKIFLYDAEAHKLSKIFSGHAGFVNGLAFSPDGKLLASAGADGRTLLWDVNGGKLIQTLLGHSDDVYAVAFSRDGAQLASASADSTVILWNVATGVQFKTLVGHQDGVRSVAFSPDGQKIVSAGEDARILVWDSKTGQLKKQLGEQPSVVNTLVFDQAGNLHAANENSEVSKINTDTGATIDTVVVPARPGVEFQSSNSEAFSVAVASEVASTSFEKRVSVATNHNGNRISSIVHKLLDWVIPVANAALPDPNQGPGGPILVVTTASDSFGKYYAEILRTEGLNEFAVADISTVNAGALAAYDVVILAQMSLAPAQVTMFDDWVNAGGNLIAMRPNTQLAGLLGISSVSCNPLPFKDRYLLVDTSRSPGNGIVNQTIQFHDTADCYTLNGATSLATLYSNATTATSYPALTLKSVGSNGGQAAAFTYDLARSIVYTRQGNPAWAAEDRDITIPDMRPLIRSNDKFFGNGPTNPGPDWIDFSKIAIPQADEQQRLLANLILEMNRDKKPLPRFAYFPRGKKAVVIMTGDDHGNGGTIGRFDQFIASSPSGCSVADWECVRGTSYIFPDTPMTDAQAAAYNSAGFEVGLHINTGCDNFDAASLEDFYTQQINEWRTKYVSIPAPSTQRHHCIVWSDWVTGAKVQFAHGIRLDTSYYFWPPEWVLNRPGFFTGSGMPMRFSDLDGTLVDVYNATTQMTDESGQQYPFTIDFFLDRALGPEAYYGAFVINAHTDVGTIPESDAVLASALPRGVPIVSSKQMLDWLDGRNSSSFGAIAWNTSSNSLSFTIAPGVGANGLQTLVPMTSSAGVLSAITRDGTSVSFTTEAFKGLAYAAFPGVAGSYVATYAADATPPTVTSKSPADGAAGVDQRTSITAVFNEVMDPATINGSTFELRDASNNVVPVAVSYNASTLTATLNPSASLTALTAYTVTIKGGAADPRVKDLAGNTLGANVTWSFTTGEPPCASTSCSGWSSSTVPSNPAVNDSGAVELGVKFKSDVDGFITGIRFYKGSTNTGIHVGNLWTSAGAQLATATFSEETASGWQQVIFSAPVPVTANTVYVASYHAPNGNYAADSNFFAAAGVDNGVIHLLRDGESGGNGVYGYSANSIFPNNTYQASNYWVDVVFTTVPPPDTMPPTVTVQSPAPNSTNVARNTIITATFSEAMDAASITASTFELRDAANALVLGTVNYDTSTHKAVLTPSSLLVANTTYTATLRGGAADPRMKDSAGNALASDLTWSFTTAPPDTTPPTVTVQSPAPSSIDVATNATITATFSEPMDATSINTATFELRNASSELVQSTVNYDANSLSAVLTPTSPLTINSTYTVIIKGGAADPRVKDVSGNALVSDVSWTFTTAAVASTGCSGNTNSIWPANPTPSIVADADTSAVELGVKFRSSVNGYVCGLRFYKGATNTGIHVGTLWNANGQPLAQVTFADEGESGWQQMNFGTPVAITANTVYVASYHAPAGHYPVNLNYFTAGITSGPLYALSNAESGGNGVYLYGAGGYPNNTYQSSNYWVDVVFTTDIGPDTTLPTVSSTSPAAGGTGALPGNPITVTFSEAVDVATVNNLTFELRDQANTVVPASYSANNNIATLTPASSLADNTLYTATLKGGESGVKDLAGNPLAADYTWTFTTGVDPCSPGGNTTVCENSKPGNPASEWDITGVGDTSIQGFATDISVNRGETVRFKINTVSTDYRLDIYRMGYYAGNGARKIATVQPTAILPQSQPNCINETATGLIDCGNWAESASWAIPADAASGIYFAKAVREDGANTGASHIVFVVRDDSSTSDILFQTSDATWQAYNDYGGNSFYTGSPAGRAYKVSYNRPFNTRAVDNGQDWVFNAEYPMVRWLEANGYNVSYTTGVDSDRRGNLIANHKIFLSVGHDEYWSAGQRSNVASARNAGVHLAFFSGNEVFWKTRWENNIINAGATPGNDAYRTLVCYKETHDNAKIDPSAVWTGTWRDPRFSPPADGGRPENALTGTIFTVNGSDFSTTSITVPDTEGKLRFWRHTSIATLPAGASATLPFGTLGYEWDEDLDNGSRPAGLIDLSTTTVNNVPVVQDYGSTYATGTAIHSLTLYRALSGALVFGAGTVQWPWGLDSNHDRPGTRTDASMQQATVNLFADMNVQPSTLQAWLIPATQSTDTTPPTSTIASPSEGSSIAPGSNVIISGTATDSGGGLVGGVEVSMDGGVTWHPATGSGNWTYNWTAPNTNGQVIIKSRAVDDSLNMESLGASITVNLGTGVDTQAPTAPGSLTASVTSATQISLNWISSTDNVAVTGYRVERCAGAGCSDFIEIATPATNSFADSGLTEGVTYRYRVRAADAAGLLSAYSAEVAAVPDATAPTAPSGLTTSAVSSTQIGLNWAASTDNVAVTGYQVERCQGAGCSSFSQIAALAATSFTDNGLAAGTTYRYRVRATDAVPLLSGYSNIAEITTNSAPVAVGDTFLYRANVLRTVNAPGPLGLGVLANDTHPQNLPLTAQLVSGSLAGGGTLNLASNGSFTYLRSTASDTVSFRYRASDGSGLSEPATGATVNMRVNAAPTTTADNCSYDRSANTVTQPTRCTVTALRTVKMDVAKNDTDPNVTTNAPTDGVGKTVVPSSVVVTSVALGVAVNANAACGQGALGLGTNATIVNNCDGTLTVAMAALNISNIVYSYQVSDDLGSPSSARSVTLSSVR